MQGEKNEVRNNKNNEDEEEETTIRRGKWRGRKKRYEIMEKNREGKGYERIKNLRHMRYTREDDE